MVKVEDIQQYGKEHFETVVASATSLQSGFQAIASAYGDYTKKSFEDTKAQADRRHGCEVRSGRRPLNTGAIPEIKKPGRFGRAFFSDLFLLFGFAAIISPRATSPARSRSI
jgi:hypothetical protein